MKLALITPTVNLAMTELLPGRFCIASVAAKNVEYLKWFATEQLNGRDVMMDNGVFEGGVTPLDVYSQVVSNIRPKILIAHDTINGQIDENYAQADAFAEMVKTSNASNLKDDDKETSYEPEIMFVIQTAERADYKMGDYLNWEAVDKVLDQFIENPNLHWLGICRDFAYQMVGSFTRTEDQEINRMTLCAMLQQRQKWITRIRAAGKKIHFLGIGDSVHLLQYAWYVDSADTASFCWQGSLGNLIGGVGVLHTKFRRPYNYFDLDLAQSKNDWAATTANCYAAQRYAQIATDHRRMIEGGRL